MLQLARRWPWFTGDRVYNTWPVAALTQEVNPDIGSESRFLPTPPAFDAPVRGVPVGILLCRLARKNYNGVATYGEKNEDMFIRFDRMHERDGHTHTQTHTHTA